MEYRRIYKWSARRSAALEHDVFLMHRGNQGYCPECCKQIEIPDSSNNLGYCITCGLLGHTICMGFTCNECLDGDD